MQNESNVLTTAGKIISIIVVLVGLVTYIYGIGQMAEANQRQVNANTQAIKIAQGRDVEIQVQLGQIETHLVYIRKSLEKQGL